MKSRLTVTEQGMDTLKELTSETFEGEKIKKIVPVIGLKNRKHLFEVVNNAFVKKKKANDKKDPHLINLQKTIDTAQLSPMKRSMQYSPTNFTHAVSRQLKPGSSVNLEASERESISNENTNLSPYRMLNSVKQRSQFKFKLRSQQNISVKSADARPPNAEEESQVLLALKELDHIAKNHPSKHIHQKVEKATQKYKRFEKATESTQSMHNLFKYIIEEDRRPGEVTTTTMLSQKYTPLRVSTTNDYLIEDLNIDQEQLNYLLYSKFSEDDLLKVKIASLSKLNALKAKQRLRKM